MAKYVCSECGMPQLVISWSGLRNHEECKQKGLLLRQKKSAPTQNIRHFFHGTVVDRVMRQWLANDPYNHPGEMPAMVEEIIEREMTIAKDTGDGIVLWKHRTDKADMTKWCKELVTKLEPILEQKILPYEYENSRRFFVPFKIRLNNGRMVQIFLAGEYDLATRDGDKQFGVHDLKGTQDENYWRKTIGQLVFYDLAMWGMFGQHTTGGGLIQPMCKRQYVPYEVTEKARGVLVGRIQRMGNDILTENFPTDGFGKYCFNCPVKHACPAWTPVNGEMQLINLSAEARTAEADGMSLKLLGE